MRFAIVLYRAVARLLPEPFRGEFAAAMEQSVLARASRRSGISRLSFILIALIDLIRTVVAERLPFSHRSTMAVTGTRADVIDRSRHDFRLAVRAFGRRPAFGFAVIVTLALGIGANTAVFSLVDAVLLRPLPVESPARLVGLFTGHADSAETSAYGLDDGLSYSGLRTLQQQSKLMTRVAGFIDVSVGFEESGGARQLTAGAVTGNYFDVLGIVPAVGRLLVSSDDKLGAPEHVAVLSDSLWTRAFGRDPHVAGHAIRIGGTSFVVVGVGPPRFRGTNLASNPDVWVPLTTLTEIRAGGIWNGPLGRRMFGDHPLHWVGTIGRLANGATASAAADEVDRLLPHSAPVPGSDRNNPSGRVVVRPLTEAAAGADRRSLVRFLAILGVVVGLTLVIACLNVANLIWTRTAERARELAVRSALGAGRWRLLWQLLLEYSLLAAAGGAAALALAAATVRLLSAFVLPGGVAIDAMHLGISVRAIAVAATLSAASALLIGLAPALAASRPASSVLLRSHGAGGPRQPRGLLVVGQVAMTLVLLVGAALFLRSLREGLRTDLGFATRSLTSVSVDLFRYGYTSRTGRAYYDDVLGRVRATPGVKGVALTSHLPLAPVGKLQFDAPDGSYTPNAPLLAGICAVSSDFFRVMGIPVISGRPIDETDAVAAPAPVAVLNETAARRLFDGRPAIGRDIRMFGAKHYTVVGIVRDAKYASVIEGAVPMVYLSVWQELPTGGVSVIVRTSRPDAMVIPLRDVVQSVDPHVALYDARAVSTRVDAVLAPQRFGTVLLGFFAVIALAVAAVGIYSAVSRMVAQRMSELGIRVALGASRGDVLHAVLRRTFSAVGAGLAIGVALAAPVATVLRSFLVGVSPLDRWSFLAAVAIFVLAAAAAVVAPARRALGADPLLMLRAD